LVFSGPVGNESRVLRGGSWNNDNTDNFRCANRNNNDPTNRNNNNGFRLARTVHRSAPESGSPVSSGACARRVQTGPRPMALRRPAKYTKGPRRLVGCGRTSSRALFPHGFGATAEERAEH